MASNNSNNSNIDSNDVLSSSSNNNNNNTFPTEEFESNDLLNKFNNLTTTDKSFYQSWTLQGVPSDSNTNTTNDNINIVSNLSFVIATQIKNLISNLTKKSIKTNSTELSTIINQYGNQAEIYLFRCLIDSIDFKELKNNNNNSQAKDQLKIQLFKDEFSRLTKQPHFTSVLCKAFEGYEVTKEFLVQFASLLKLTPTNEAMLGLALSQSLDKSIREQADKYLLSTLSQISQANTKSLPENLLHQLLYKFKIQQSSLSAPQQPPYYYDILKYLQSICPPSSLALSPLVDDSYLSSSSSLSTNTNINNSSSNNQNSQNTTTSSQVSKRQQQDNPSYVNSIISKVSQTNNPSQLIQSLGISNCSSASTLKEILLQFPKITEADVAQILGSVAQQTVDGDYDIPYLSFNNNNNNSSSSNNTTDNNEGGGENNNNNNKQDSLEKLFNWNYNVFVQVVKEISPSLDWNIVIRELDYPYFYLQESIGVSLILEVYKTATFNSNTNPNPIEKFPLHYIFDRIWLNSLGQISFITAALPCLDFPLYLSSKKRLEQSMVEKLSPLIANWNSVSLIEILLQLSEVDKDHLHYIRTLFEFPLKNCPDILLLGLLSIQNCKNNQLRNQMISILFPILLHHNYQSYLFQLWKDYPNLIVQGMADIYSKDPSSLSRLLDIAQESRILTPMLNFKTYPFIIDLALLASQREYLFLERWLQERMKEDTDFQFVRACTIYLVDRALKKNQSISSKLGNNNNNNSDPQPVPISSAILLIFYKTLMSGIDSFPVDIVNDLKQNSPITNDEIINSNNNSGGGGSNITTSGGVVNNNGGNTGERRFSQEIEEETNSYFFKLYSEELTVDQIITILKEYKNSKNQRDQDIFKCLLFNIFDEYKFLTDYPDKELRITGYLFGALIKHQLISSQPLRVALKYVLEALRHPINSNMFIFGINSLMSFANRLVEWPQYWQQICAIDHFSSNYSDIISKINTIIETSDPTKNSLDFQKSVNSPPATTILTSQQIQDADNFMFDSLPNTNSNNSSPTGSGMINIVDSSNNNNTSKLGNYQDEVEEDDSSKQSKNDPKSSASIKRNKSQEKTISTPPPPGMGLPLQQQSPIPTPTISSSQQTPPPKSNKSDLQEDAFSSTIPLGTLLSASKEIIQPDDFIKDKMYFIINNISIQNLDIKTKEMKDILKPEYQDFLAQYLVVKRVSIEANFHNLYLNFIDRLNIPTLSERILYYTHQNVHTLLKSEKLKVDHSERSLLKNLGGWLGLNTLAKNKPLLQKVIAPKDLLIYAAENGLLIAIVPFVAKLLEYASQSKVFRPPNPWVMAIMRQMLEIYHLKDSKNNIKFEIELLANNLSLDLNSIKPSTLIADRRQQRELEQQQLENGQLQQQHQSGQQQQQQLSSMDLLTNISSYITFNSSIGAYAQSPMFKKAVPLAFDKAVREIILPVVERSVAIAVITSKELVSKDFATEADEKKMKKASHLMVQNLAGSLALVTCKDPLRVSIVTYLRTLLQSNMQNLDGLPLDHAISIVCNDNLDFACSIVERAATEKAIISIDDVLASSYNDRLKHKEHAGSQPFFDMGYLTTTIYNTLPESLRPKPGGIQPDQFRVYEDFLNLPHQSVTPSVDGGSPSVESVLNVDNSKVIHQQQQQQQQPTLVQQQQIPSMTPIQQMQMQQQLQQQQLLQMQMQQQAQQQLQKEKGNQTSPPPSAAASQQPQTQLGQQQQQTQPTNTTTAVPNSELLERFAVFLNEVDSVVIRALQATQQIDLELLYNVSQQIISYLRLSNNQGELLAGLAQKLFNRLNDPEKKPMYEIYFELMEVLRDFDQKVIANITSFLLYSTPDKKITRVLVAGLIIHQLINVNEYDIALSKMMLDPTRSVPAIEFATNLLRFCIVENPYANLVEFPATLELLTKIAHRQPNEFLIKTLEDLKNGPKEEKKRRVSRIRQEDMIMDPPLLREAVIALLQDWLVFSSANSDQKLLIQYLSQVLQISFMKNELYFIKFFRIGLEWSLERYQSSIELNNSNNSTSTTTNSGASSNNNPPYLEIDSYCKFVVLMVKHGDPTKLNILTKVLSVLIKVLGKDYDSNPLKFNQRPYLRIFENLLVDLNAPDPILEHVSTHILFYFVNAFATLHPSKYPGFCFAWLDLISHRCFMPKLLLKNQKQWLITLLVQHFKFLDPFVRGEELSEPVKLLYKSTVKVLLVLLHDFPEFLCEYHSSFCDVIPTSCCQLRNLVLSAFPRSMRLPDPFTPNLKVDHLPDINTTPKITANFNILKNYRVEIDNYLKNRGPYSFLNELKFKNIFLTDADEIAFAGTRYNVAFLNSFVLYIGSQVAPTQRGKPITSPYYNASMDIFLRLTLDIDLEGRYLLFNAIVNQLRYPNNHTNYFSCVLLYLFGESGQDMVKEQITRVLLDRLITHKPHPWGLLITFLELIKNVNYNFWNHNFTKIAPEISQLFSNITAL
ncbi:hypothetical protein CYY_006997 [Polysphondylium violaceum]|uniref:CCR4-NOT complex subunit 1 n=1 Tax=Polysphondylium violaceum TaxID=133409 RepID=A0A8J4PYF7_9MYCE|nr:hypothetical protein CYY_006997 [Polysphondylium violaceum]